MYWWRKSAYADNTILEGEVVVKVRMRSGCDEAGKTFNQLSGPSWAETKGINQSPVIRFAKGAILAIKRRWDFRNLVERLGNKFQARHPLPRAWPQLPTSQIFQVEMSRWSTLHESGSMLTLRSFNRRFLWAGSLKKEKSLNLLSRSAGVWGEVF